MDAQWQRWTQENLDRGCSPHELVNILRKHGFADPAIEAVMAERFPPECRQQSVDYAALSRPPLVQAPAARAAVQVDEPRLQLYVIDNFLSAAECQQVMALMDARLRPSTITTGEDKYGFRTSATCDLGRLEAPLIAELDQRIARALGMNDQWAEVTQGQKYLVGQEFKAHTDSFAPGTPEYERFAGSRGQRTWTFMVYLNQTEAGGATRFTRLDRQFLPQPGRALIWNNLLPDGAPNAFSEHHGMPVLKGDKSIITKWYRDRGPGPMFPG